MTQEAISRYGNIKAVHTEKAIQSILMIAQLVQEGKLTQKITDDQYKRLLQEMTPQKKEFKIIRK